MCLSLIKSYFTPSFLLVSVYCLSLLGDLTWCFTTQLKSLICIKHKNKSQTDFILWVGPFPWSPPYCSIVLLTTPCLYCTHWAFNRLQFDTSPLDVTKSFTMVLLINQHKIRQKIKDGNHASNVVCGTRHTACASTFHRDKVPESTANGWISNYSLLK